ncbi:exonuclease domain-containing protein [Knoellia aerolata]|uniref:exonuclease domain-containing protein n=1 Tax=Knoellia aerolata TaxID=442954 RepID=UPI00146FE093|nr:exonuclease domain-containing protein [Knoellia aerolata]
MGAGEMGDVLYAVLDTETTGLSPQLQHRVIELAVVLVDEQGNVESEWSTLLNPNRDLGPQHIHGIRAGEVLNAPSFGDVAGFLAEMLRGRVLVAHNLRFDRLFLDAEYDRLGVPFPLAPGMGICTMTVAGELLVGSGRSLRDCCQEAQVPLMGWHAALNDARATAGLLRHFISVTDPDWPWKSEVSALRGVPWPYLDSPSFTACIRRSQDEPTHGIDLGLLDRIVDFMPRADAADLTDPYLAVLDEALSDRYLSADESGSLRALAAAMGIGPDTVFSMHREYLNALARVALADNHLSQEEEADLYRVAEILDLPAGAVPSSLEAARASAQPLTAGQLDLPEGSMIVFTGAMAEPRELWMQRADDHGWVAHPAVTKKVALVVSADTDSLSGKAKKARGFGIPIMSIDDFRDALGYPPASDGQGLMHENWGDSERKWAKALKEAGGNA